MGWDKSLNVSLVNTPLPSINFVSIFPWQIDVIDETKIDELLINSSSGIARSSVDGK